MKNQYLLMKKSGRALWPTVAGSVLLAALLVGGLIFWLSGSGEEEHDHSDGETQWYISGMHPWIIQPGPGLCPVCGMELTPLRPDMLTGSLDIDPLITQNIGVRLATVERGQMVRAHRTYGEVEYDARRVSGIVPRADVYLEKLRVRYVGQTLTEGEVLAELHSPRVQAAGYELLATLPGGQAQRIEAARTKLRLLGVAAEDIARIEESGEVGHTFALRAPHDGVVTRLEAREGTWLGEGATLLEMADLSSLWIRAVTYPHQQGDLRTGLSARIRANGGRDREEEGEISFLYPSVDPRTRQREIRLEVSNANGTWVPGEWVEVLWQSEPEAEQLLVPRMAILDTGPRQMAFVSLGNGRFEPREVRLGRENRDGQVEILEGLEEGESLVLSSQFLLDSESKIREAILKLVEGDTVADQPVEREETGGEAVAWEEEISSWEASALTSSGEDLWGEMIGHYLGLQRDLAADRLGNHPEGVRAMKAAWDRLVEEGIEGDAHFWHQRMDLVRFLSGYLQAMEEGAEMDEVRRPLREFSRVFIALLEHFGSPGEYAGQLIVYRCPMYPEMGDHAWWLQKRESIANPYWGAQMLRCQDQSRELP